MDGYGVPPSGPSARNKYQDLSSEEEEEQGVGFPAGGAVSGSDSETEVPVKEKGKPKKSAICSRCSVRKMCAIIDSFDGEKRDIVQQMDFGGILHLQKTKQDRHFLLWLYDHVDEQASSITTGHNRVLPFGDKDIGIGIGVPLGVLPVRVPNHAVPEQVVAEIRAMFNIGPNDHDIAPMVEVLKRQYARAMTSTERKVFKVAFTICVCTYILAPSLKNDYFVTDYWGALANPDLIHMYNWCGYVREEILATAKRVRAELRSGGEKANLTGCLPFMQVFYIDNLDVGARNIQHNEFPRVRAYDNAKINFVMTQDLLSRKGAVPAVYGRLLPRPATEVCYQRNPHKRRGESSGVNKEYVEAVSPNVNTINIKEALYMVLDKISSYSSRCQEVLVSTSRKREEENHRHFSALNNMDNAAQQSIKRETDMIRKEFYTFFSNLEQIDNGIPGRKPIPGRQHGACFANNEQTQLSPGLHHNPVSATTPPDRRIEGTNDGKSPDVVEVTPRRFKKVSSRKKRVRFEGHRSSPLAIDNSARTTDALDECGELGITPAGLQGLVGENEESNPRLDDLIFEAERYKMKGKQAADEGTSNPNNALDLMPSWDRFEGFDHATGEMYPPHCAQVPTSGDKRRWLYPEDCPLMTEVPSFDLGIDTPPAAKTKSASQTRLTVSSDVRRVRLFEDSPASSNNPGVSTGKSPITPICLDGKLGTQNLTNTTISPVSRTRTVSACLLDYREDVEASAVNLNITAETDPSTQPPRKRRVAPGPAGRSPFVCEYRLSDRATGNATHIYLKFTQMTGLIMSNNWVISQAPSYIEITGDALKRQLGVDGAVGTDLMNLFMRRFQQLENEWCSRYGESAWRHYLEPDFVSHILRKDDYLSSDYVRGLFIGDHIKHDVHRCSMIVLPVNHAEAWSTYFFDFTRRRTTILDPMINNGDRTADEVQNEHRKLADELREGLIECIHEFFDGWAPNTTGWQNWFPKQTTGPWVCSRESSGIFALHNARQWMGTKLQRTMSPMGDGLDQSRMILLYEVLGTKGNIGQLPTKFRICLSQE